MLRSSPSAAPAELLNTVLRDVQDDAARTWLRALLEHGQAAEVRVGRQHDRGSDVTLLPRNGGRVRSENEASA